MSIEHRRLQLILSIIQEIVDSGTTSFRPGHVNDVLREQNSPIGNWQVRADFTELERKGVLQCDESSGDWQLTEAGREPLKSAG